MSQKTSKSAGWRFQSTRKCTGLISFNGSICDTLDSETLNQFTEQVQTIDTEDLAIFLRIVPPLDQLLQQVPYSLPLIEAIYLKCEVIHMESGSNFPLKELHCEQLFCQLVWYTAFCEQENHNGTMNKKMPTFKEMEPCMRTVLGVLGRQCAGLVDRAQADRRQLSSCLESLGCHGLVNCSTGLIRMNDAIHMESMRHAERLKSLAMRLKEATDSKDNHGAMDPSIASHQRQMSLRLSEVFQRLKLNEMMESVLEDAITNAHLTSLLRIVRKRTASDRLLIGLFNAFTRAAPDDFSFEQLDPVVAKLIVVFNNAYEQLLCMCPIGGECDSGCSADGSTEGGRSSTSTHTDSPEHRGLRQSGSYGSTRLDSTDETTERPRSRSSGQVRRYRGKRNVLHSSLKDINRTVAVEGCIKPARSLSNIATVAERDETDLSEDEQQDIVRLRLHVDHLKSELRNARRQIDHLTTITKELPASHGLWPEPDYPEATSYYNCSSREDVAGLVKRFSDLFERGQRQVLPALDCLPEFQGSDELQQKTLLSIVVLTYRSIVESVDKRRQKIWEVIQEGDSRPESEESAMLDVALYRHMFRRAKSQRGMNNAKEVTAQIWRTLYDFPSLKTCTVFNRFVLECVDMVWDLVAGIDGRLPRMRIEYEGREFDEERHESWNFDDLPEVERSQTTGITKDIKLFLWPALVDDHTQRCLRKAIVITS